MKLESLPPVWERWDYDEVVKLSPDEMTRLVTALENKVSVLRELYGLKILYDEDKTYQRVREWIVKSNGHVLTD